MTTDYTNGNVRYEETPAEIKLYDERGRLTSKTFKSWGTIIYTYDETHRLAIATYPDGSRVVQQFGDEVRPQ